MQIVQRRIEISLHGIVVLNAALHHQEAEGGTEAESVRKFVAFK
jgi:hypothetical protein